MLFGLKQTNIKYIMGVLVADMTIPEFDDENSVINFPLKKSQLADFIKSLLGSQRRDSLVISGVFRLDKGDMKTIIEKVSQRVEAQHKAVTTSISISVVYDSQHTRTFDAPKEFFSMQETDSNYAREVRVNFIFLIQFPNDESPKKQDLSLTFSTEADSHTQSGQINCQLSSTNIFWANDFIRFLKDELRPLVSKVRSEMLSKLKPNTLVSSMVAFIFFFFLVWMNAFSFSSEEFQAGRLSEQIESLQKPTQYTEEEQKLFSLENEVRSDEWRQVVDDYERMLAYIDVVEREKRRSEELSQSIEELKRLEATIEEKNKILVAAGELFGGIFRFVVEMVLLPAIILLTILAIVRIRDLKVRKSNKSFLWLQRPTGKTDQLVAKDFTENFLVGVISSIVASSLIYLVVNVMF